MTHSDRQTKAWTFCVVLALTLLAPALGGSTALWAQAAIALGTGLLFLFAPPKRSLGPLANALFAILLLLALTAYLPAAWFAPDELRIAFAKFGVQLPAVHTPQPWITLESTLLLFLGLAWTYLLFAYEWDRQLRENAWLAYAAGIFILAAALIVAFVTKERVPFWPNVPEFGFFPNRNQTSNVLGLGGVMIYALGLQRFQENRRYWWLWPASLSLICWALILNYSRAGIILFFFGALAVHIYWWSAAKDRRQPLVAFGGLVLLIALFIVDGGATLMRFGSETTAFFSPSRNLRLGIYRDAFSLLTKIPVLGIGLGNFHPIFSLHRHYSAAQSESIHPESDWFWTAIELGWFAPLVVLLLFVWWIKRCLPLEPRTFRIMRVAALVCGCAFAVHGFLDVSGHRIGALWPALFLASSALHPHGEYRRSPPTAVIFRILGAFFIAVSAWWFASVSGVKVPPTTATLARLTAQVEIASNIEDYQEVMQLASTGLKIAPLNWLLSYKRAFAEAALYRPRSEAMRDFAVARYLLPNWPELYLKEGETWLGAGDPDLAFETWQDGMRRFPAEAPRFYSQIFDLIKSDVNLIDRWRKLGETNKECLLFFFGLSDRLGFEIELERLLSDDSELHSFTPEELKLLFSTWYEKGDRLWLAQTLREHPEWRKIAWQQLARAYADYEDYRQAYETLREFVPAPNVPHANSSDSSIVLQSRFRVNPTDVDEGFALCSAQIREGKIDDALSTLHSLVLLRGSPKYFRYLEAELWARKKDWQKAWQALSEYKSGSG